MDKIKIAQLQIENTKRVKAVRLEPSRTGLTVIGGNNRQGKTSVLDAITWALGGNKYRPTKAQREGSVSPPHIQLVLDNGLIVERKGKNSDLKVTDPDGQKYGQNLLDSFVEEFALNLPKFMNLSSKEKGQELLKLMGIEAQLLDIERRETALYNERTHIGRIADQKEKFAAEQPYYPDAPEAPVSPSELLKQQQAILVKNGENQKKRRQLEQLQSQSQYLTTEIDNLGDQIRKLQETLASKLEQRDQLEADIKTGKKSVAQLKDESTAELEESIANIEEINVKVRGNLDKAKAEDDAKDYREQYVQLTTQIEAVRGERAALLANAKLPLPGLTVEDGNILYNGYPWDNMSGADQLIVATSIVKQLKPQCGFVLLDRLEAMDSIELTKFSDWLTEQDLQAIATRVSTGNECTIIISDGYVEGQEGFRPLGDDPEEPAAEPPATTWAPGKY